MAKDDFSAPLPQVTKAIADVEKLAKTPPMVTGYKALAELSYEAVSAAIEAGWPLAEVVKRFESYGITVDVEAFERRLRYVKSIRPRDGEQ